MSNKFHKDLGVAENHVIQHYEFADLNALNAPGPYVSGDIGKVARKTNDDTFWLLTAINGSLPVWDAMAAGSLVSAVSIGSGIPIIQDHISGILHLRSFESSSGTVGIKFNVFDETIDFNIYPPSNIVYVSQNPGPTQFSSISTAVNSITNASLSNTYLVDVAPGTYIEPTIVMKPYVSLRGAGEDVTFIQTASTSQHGILLADFSDISDLHIGGATDSGFCAVLYTCVTPNAYTILDSIRFGSNNICAKSLAVSGNAQTMSVHDSFFGGIGLFDKGLVATGNGASRIAMRSSAISPAITAPGPTVFAIADGPGCQIVINGAQLRTGSVPISGDCLVAQNGGALRIIGVNPNGWNHAIHLPNIGAASLIRAEGISFENNNMDIVVEHPGATGSLTASPEYSKVSINNASSVFIVGRDAHVITVAKKGGDFSSISAACASITDASAQNKYLVSVGPGIFTEPLIYVPPFVALQGSNISATTIVPDTSNHPIIDVDISGELAFMTLEDSGPGQPAILSNNRGNFTQVHKVSIYNCDIGILQRSTNVDSQMYLQYVDINGVYTNAVRVESLSGQSSFVNAENFYTFPDTSNNNDNIVVSGSLAHYDSLTFGIFGAGSASFGVSGLPKTDVGIRVTDGASIGILGGYFDGCGSGVVIDNVGTNPFAEINGVQFTDCTIDIDIQNPTATGSFTGDEHYLKTLINPLSDFFITGKDLRIVTAGNRGADFPTISDALTHINPLATSDKPYEIRVGPGTFIEPLLDVQDYVSVRGESQDLTRVLPDGNHDIFNLNNNTSLSFITLSGAPAGYSAINSVDSTVRIHKVTINDSDTGVTQLSRTALAIGTYEYIDINGQFSYGLKLLSQNGAPALANATDFFTNTVLGEQPFATHVYVSGSVAQLAIVTFGLNGQAVPTGNDSGVIIAGGGLAGTIGGYIRNINTAIQIENDGQASTLKAAGVAFQNCGQELNILSSGAVGSFTGYSDYSKLYINPLSTFFITNKDLQIVTVAKRGGDFSSVATAVAAITDASITKPYVIAVGPGVFVEPQITMKQFISVKGLGDNQSTVIVAASTSQKVFVGADNAALTNVTITGATASGGVGIYHEGAGTFTPFQVKNCVFNNNFTQIQAFGAVAPTILLIEACLMGGTGNQTNGLIASSNPGVPVQLAIVDLIYQDVIPGFSTGDFINVSGPTSELIIENVLTRIGFPTGNGVVLSDGASARITSISLLGFQKGIWVQNIGSAPFLKANATLENNTVDIQNDHPGTTGSIFGSATESKIINANPSLPILIQDISAGNLLVTGTMKLGIPGHGFQDASTLIIESSTMGSNEGGGLTKGSGLILNIGTGFGYVEIEPELLIRIDWPDTSIVLPPSSNSYVYFNQNSILTAAPALPDTRRVCLLGRVVTDSGAIDFIDATPMFSEHTSNLYDKLFREALGPIFGTGCTITSNVSGNLAVTAGHYFFSMNEFNTSGLVMGAPFETYYLSNSGTVLVGMDNVTTVDSSNWNDLSSVSGLVPLAPGVSGVPGNYAKHSLYTVGQGVDEKYFMVYSQSQYTLLSLAEQGNIPIPPPYFIDGVTLIGSIITQQGSGIVEIRDERPKIGFKAGGIAAITNHGQLLGLLDNDHPQYLLRDGTNAMVGNLDMGGNNMINLGTVQGVVVSGHAARHLPNGADPLTTAGNTSNLNGNSTNSVGIQNSLARSDHGHAVDNATQTVAGFMSASDKIKIDGIPSTISGDLFTSGQIVLAKNALNTTAINTLSGNLITSGQTLLAVDALLTTAVNTLSGIVITNQTLDTAAIATMSGNLITSGQTLLANESLLTTAVNTLSGIVITNQTLDTAAIATLSGNLITSGQTLNTFHNLDVTAINTLSGIVITNQTLDTTAIATMSGNLITSGQTLNTFHNLDVTAINTLSGIVITNQTLDTVAIATMSGNLITSGQTLLTTIIASGQVTVPIIHGGTGQTTKAAAFDALAPTTTSGDLIVFGNATNGRLPVQSSGNILIVDPTQAFGMKWAPIDLDAQTVSGVPNTSTTSPSLVDITGVTLTTTGRSNTKKYLIEFAGVFASTTNNQTMSLQFMINGVAQTNTSRTIRVGSSTGANFPGPMMSYIATVPPAQIIKVQWSTTGGTLTMVDGTLNIFGIA